MESYKNKLILISLLVSESTWLFVILTSISIIAGMQTSPLNWHSIFIIMGFSMFLTQLGRIYFRSIDLTSVIIPTLGAFLIYIFVGLNLVEKNVVHGLIWVFEIRYYLSESFGYHIIAGIVSGVLLWWRGGKVSAEEDPVFSLQSSFRLGLLGMAISIVVDIESPDKIQVFPLVFLFFASGLSGLSIGHILPHSDQSQVTHIWYKVISASIAVILIVGIAATFLKKDFWVLVSEPVYKILELVVIVMVWIFFVPIAFIFNLLHNFLMSVFNPEFNGEIQRRDDQVSDASIDEPLEGFENLPSNIDSIQFNIIQIIEWVSISVIAVLVASILLVVFKKIFYAKPINIKIRKESVIHESDPIEDAKNLLLKLLPKWIKTRKIYKTQRRINGPSGIVNPIKMYYRLLDMAETDNVVRMPDQTPSEFQRHLRKIFPDDLVRMATTAFNRAFYGTHPISDEDLLVLKSKIDTTKDGFTKERNGTERD